MNLNLYTLTLIIFIPMIFSYFFAILLQQKTIELIPVLYSLSVVWVYVFSVFDNLELGFRSFLPALFLVCLLCYKKIRKKFFKFELLKSHLSPALAAFTVITVWAYSHSRFMRFYEWDEFSYWGSTVKSIYFFKQLPAFSPNQGAFPEYLPGIPIFGSIFALVENSWRESIVFWSYQTFIISIVFAILYQFSWRQLNKFFFAFLITILAVVYFYNSFQSVYADPILSILFGYTLLIAASKQVSRNKTYLINFTILISFLALTKDTAMYFILISTAVLALNLFISSENLTQPKKILRFKSFLWVGLTLIPVFILKALWSDLLSRQQLSLGRDFFSIVKNLLLGNFDLNEVAYWTEIKSNFIDRTINQTLTNVNGISFSSFEVLLLIVILIALSKVTRNRSKVSRIRDNLTALFLFAGGLGYLGVLLLAYATVFVTNEAIGLASYDRYFGAYIGGLFLFFSGTMAQNIHEINHPNINKAAFVYPIIFILLQSSPERLVGFLTNPNTYSDQIRSSYTGQSWLISEMAFKKDDKVWIITQHKVGFEFYLLQYELIPASVGKIPFSIGSASGPGDIWTDTTYNVEKWSKALQDFDYVFIDNTSGSFNLEFNSMFEDPGTLNQLPGIYEIDKGSSKVTLTRVR